MKHAYILITALLPIILLSAGCASAEKQSSPAQKAAFSEIWAYLMRGEEKELSGTEPITDLCHFSAEINYRGELVPMKPLTAEAKLPAGVRLHYVIADISNQAKMHLVLRGDLPFRQKLIADIAAASAPYDGVQIDFESVNPDDRELFLSFLAGLKTAIAPRMLSIAIPARTAKTKEAFDYAPIGAVCDRVFIMAYDQHWSGSEPGPVAGDEWCGKVAAYAVSQIPREKLIMGLPFYGRSWQDKKTSRAWKYSGIQELLRSVKPTDADPRQPSFTYKDTVNVTVFYEDNRSLLRKAAIYHAAGARGIGFWRVGQQPADFWPLIEAVTPGKAEKRL